MLTPPNHQPNPYHTEFRALYGCIERVSNMATSKTHPRTGRLLATGIAHEQTPNSNQSAFCRGSRPERRQEAIDGSHLFSSAYVTQRARATTPRAGRALRQPAR